MTSKAQTTKEEKNRWIGLYKNLLPALGPQSHSNGKGAQHLSKSSQKVPFSKAGDVPSLKPGGGNKDVLLFKLYTSDFFESKMYL